MVEGGKTKTGKALCSPPLKHTRLVTKGKE